jgi:hypothetical protein
MLGFSWDYIIIIVGLCYGWIGDKKCWVSTTKIHQIQFSVDTCPNLRAGVGSSVV